MSTFDNLPQDIDPIDINASDYDEDWAADDESILLAELAEWEWFEEPNYPPY